MDWFCLFGAACCFIKLVYIEANAISVMHQIYGAEYGIMGTIFICMLFFLKISENRDIKNKE